MEQLRRSVAAGSACDVCGRLPHPHRFRLSLAKLAAVLPVELALHALVLAVHPPYLLAVGLLAVTSTALVIWVVEPSAMRLLRGWLHAPDRRTRRAAHETIERAPSLWRIRVTLDDETGQLDRLTGQLAELDVNILDLTVHPLADGVRDELVVCTSDTLAADDLLVAVEAAGGRDVQLWPTTALALVDGQTEALNLAARVVADPSELPHAISELLGARVVTDRLAISHGLFPSDGSVLKVPSPWSGLIVFTRAGEAFTPAESARAHRLAQIAELSRTERPLVERG
ncbi:amino acid-binding protein [Kribbella sp. ALI-6-A]|uniref:amino acid-binding protein n=1 Tax=Kribbella sp. ALI-6-A TaxID=1933817 RepID=UPI00097C255E|nr:amino acid-binding protein [Kribbella sp. ALI-6-A]ONI70120.1 amino acid-binding protein [Kribbella sp. ALI-6-A]